MLYTFATIWSSFFLINFDLKRISAKQPKKTNSVWLTFKMNTSRRADAFYFSPGHYLWAPAHHFHYLPLDHFNKQIPCEVIILVPTLWDKRKFVFSSSLWWNRCCCCVSYFLLKLYDLLLQLNRCVFLNTDWWLHFSFIIFVWKGKIDINWIFVIFDQVECLSL